MQVKELKKLLENWADDYEVCLSIDSEINEIKAIDEVYTMEVHKESNGRTREIVLIVPTDKIYERY